MRGFFVVPSRWTEQIVNSCLAILVAGLAANAWGSPQCQAVFGDPAVPVAGSLVGFLAGSLAWSQLPSVNEAALGREFIGQLEQQRSVRELRGKFGTGVGVVFSLPLLNKTGGWKIQSNFVAKTLRMIFPDAIIEEKPTPHSGRRTIELRLFDDGILHSSPKSASVGAPTATENSAKMLEMKILKAANPGPPVGSKSAARRVLGLPPDARIVSLYVAKNVDGLDAVKTLFNQTSTDVVIFSAQFDHPSVVDQLESAFKSSLSKIGVRLVRSAELPVAFESGLKYLILNETRGLLPVIHSSADAVVILGSANFFEAVNTGRPTFAQSVPKDFSLAVWNEMKAQALQTGNFAEFSSLKVLPEFLAQAEKMAPTKPLFETLGADGLTPVDRYFEHLRSTIDQAGP